MKRQADAFDQEARDAMKRASGKLAASRQGELGPKRPQLINRIVSAAPTVTKDGVTVAKEIQLPDHTRTWAPDGERGREPDLRRGR